MQEQTENILLGTFIVALIAVTVAMGYVTYEKEPHPADKTLRILIPATPDYKQIQAALSAEYTRIHPEMKISTIEFSWQNIWQKLEYMIVANIPPDISGIEQPKLPYFVHLNAVEPLDGWIARDPSFDAEAIFPECMDEGNWNNTQWAIPDNFSTTCLWYNKTLFDRAGVAYPTRDWSKEDMVAAARKLTVDYDSDGQPDQWGFFNNNNHWNRYPSWIWMDGGEFMAEDNRTCTFDDPKVISGIRWLAGLALTEKVQPPMQLLSQFSTDNLFLTGRLAMYAQTRYFLPTFFLEKNKDKIRSFEWDVAELPHGEKRATTFVVGLNIIPSTVKPERKKMAWDYLSFLSSETGQSVYAGLNAGIPARKDVAWRMVEHAGVPPANDRAFIDALPYARYFYWPAAADPEFIAARSALYSVWSGLADAERVCKEAAVNINRAVAAFERKYPDAEPTIKTRWIPIDKRGDPVESEIEPASAAAPGKEGA